MKRHPWGLITFLTLFLVLYLVARSAAMTEPVRLDLASNPLERGLKSDWTDRTPVIRAVEPDEGQPWRPYPTEEKQPVRCERDAILPEPVNGRDLVGRVLGTQQRQPVDESRPQVERPRRVSRPERLGPGYVVPVSHGG